MERPFVIHIHSGFGQGHWDLMISHQSALATWQFLVPPDQIDKTGQFSAVKLPDHRLHYLTYQGPISNSRGEVTFWDSGNCDVLCCDSDKWDVIFRGGRLLGRVEFIHQSDDLWQICRGD